MCRPVSDYPAIVKAEHSVHCLILGVFFFPGQLNSFYTKRGKQTCILRNNPAVYPSVKATKNKMISMLKYCIGLFQNFIKWITFSYNKGARGGRLQCHSRANPKHSQLLICFMCPCEFLVNVCKCCFQTLTRYLSVLQMVKHEHETPQSMSISPTQQSH